jgi:RimJ/RimL family protein N-acetyltransferase
MKPVDPLGPWNLKGRFVTLEPLEPRHHSDLIRVADGDPTIWTHMPLDMRQGFAAHLPWYVDEMASGRQFTYVVRLLSDGEVVGSSSYLAITPADAKLEIGASWFAAGARGTAVNPEAKLLMLENAFRAGYNRIEFKTDARNARSRAALRKLGAIEEGTLRAHRWIPPSLSREHGYFRDSVYYSILAAEWPVVRQDLERRLASFR